MLLTLSRIWILIHTLVVFGLLFDSRFSRRKTTLITLVSMAPLMLFNLWYVTRFGGEAMVRILLLTCTLPSLLLFFLLAKHRDGRFLFTFCFADTLALEITYLTYLISYYLRDDTHIVNFLLRLAAFPLLEWVLLKYLRGRYIEMQRSVRKGWGGFAAIGGLFYLLMTLMCGYPTVITDRPHQIPALLLVMLLMPLMYWCILSVLYHQQELYETRQQEQLLLMQSTMLEQRVAQFSRAGQDLAIQRHDLRHRFHTLEAMLEKGGVGEALDYIRASQEQLTETAVRRWCLHPVLDAVFSACFRQAESSGVRIEADIDLPEDLPVDAMELSVVLANALENAIHAVEKLPEEQRIIHCRCIHRPQLMFRVSNPFSGTVEFDAAGYPASAEDAHGLGTRSIAAYCAKHNAYCTCRTENGWFILQIVQTIWN